MQEVKCRIAPSLGEGFAGTPEEVWGTSTYNSETDIEKPCVFFGLYGLNDFHILWRHKGKKWILWAGSDIRHFIEGYWLDALGDIRLKPESMARWINENCESWVENDIEKQALEKIGIKSKICPSFLGNVKDYKVEYKWSERPKLYTSVSGDDFKLYGWDKINSLAQENPFVEFHLYGNRTHWKTHRNIFVHGRLPQEQMDEEIKHMQGALRLTEFDGFSEILAKSVLWGQYPVSIIKYAGMFTPEDIGLIKSLKQPNIQARNYYVQILNKYPWTK